MKRIVCIFPTLLGILLPFSPFAHSQAWTGILIPSRAADWGESYGAGLPPRLPDGETTTNPWTPPSRSQCGSTVAPSGGDDTAQITNAIESCTAGHYVLLGAGTFQINSTFRISPGYNAGVNNVSLRGSGAQSTKIDVGSSGSIYIGAAAGGGACTLTSSSNFSQGATSITCSGSTPPVGTMAWLNQCDTGKSGPGCTAGSEADNGSVWVCADQTICSNQSAGGTSFNNQEQNVIVQSVAGTCSSSCTVTFEPGLYMPQWAYASSPTLTWDSTTYTSLGVGFEDFTVDFSAGTTSNNGAFQLDNCYSCWIKGVRFVGANAGSCCGIYLNQLGNVLFSNNYLFTSNPITQAGEGLPMASGNDTSILILNNIWQSGGGINDFERHAPSTGNVFAYNYARDSVTTQMYATDAEHYGGIMMNLREGNQMGGSKDDNTWGTHDMDTWFRNDYSCYDPPYIGLAAPLGISINDFSRFENAIGNVMDSSGACSSYQISSDNSTPYIWGFGSSDTLALGTSMRWGNVSTDLQSTDTPPNSGVRFVVTELPTLLLSPNPNYEISSAIPQTLPASFFMDSIKAHASGGTGLSWWKVCTRWGTFPSSCSASQTQPFPPIGPDVSGGSYVNGYAYDIPAAVAWKNLPVDTSYQNSYAITSSSWSGGTETLTFNSGVLPSAASHIMGGFRLSGVNAGCTPSSGVSFTGRPDGELLMTGSSATTVKYALATNPGVTCTGTMLFPDIRQFDERVYEADSSVQPAPPSSVGGNPVQIP
jgi:hypothetical protein